MVRRAARAMAAARLKGLMDRLSDDASSASDDAAEGVAPAAPASKVRGGRHGRGAAQRRAARPRGDRESHHGANQVAICALRARPTRLCADFSPHAAAPPPTRSRRCLVQFVICHHARRSPPPAAAGCVLCRPSALQLVSASGVMPLCQLHTKPSHQQHAVPQCRQSDGPSLLGDAAGLNRRALSSGCFSCLSVPCRPCLHALGALAASAVTRG